MRPKSDAVEDGLFAREIVTPVAAYAMANIVFTLAPVLIGVLMDRQSLAASQAGLVTALDMLATVIPGFLLGKYLAGHTKRTLLVAGSVAVLVGNLLSAVFSGVLELSVIRTLSGLGAGLLFACSNAMLATTSDPVRAYGLATIGATLSGSALLFGLPLLIGRFGSAGYYLVVAGLAAGFAYVGMRGPRESAVSGPSSGGAGVWSVGSLRLLLLALGVVLLTIPLEAYWSFAERIGLRTGASPQLLGAVFSASYVCGIFTSALASWLSTRWGLMRMMTIGFALQALAIMAASTALRENVVLAAMILQTLALCFGAPYLFGLGAEADESGKFANVVVGLFYLTLAIGTYLGGVLIESVGANAIAELTAVATVLGLVATLPAAMMVRARRRMVTTP